MTLNEKEYKHIMWPIVKYGLTKAGISSVSIKRSYMGLNILEEFDYFTSSWFKKQV